jgi:hypothetical protein
MIALERFTVQNEKAEIEVSLCIVTSRRIIKTTLTYYELKQLLATGKLEELSMAWVEMFTVPGQNLRMVYNFHIEKLELISCI